MHLSQTLVANSISRLVNKLHERGEADIIAYQPSDDYAYDDDLFPPPPPKQSGARRRVDRTEGGFGGLQELLRNKKQLGAVLLGVGLILTFMGMMLFFEGNLLRLGNISLIAGIFLLIGPGRVSGFFMKESRIQATIITTIGILLVFWGKPKIGLLIEIFGLLNLFGNMFPMLLAVGRSIPVVGDVIKAVEGEAQPPRRPRYPPQQQPPPPRRSYSPDF